MADLFNLEGSSSLPDISKPGPIPPSAGGSTLPAASQTPTTTVSGDMYGAAGDQFSKAGSNLMGGNLAKAAGNALSGASNAILGTSFLPVSAAQKAAPVFGSVLEGVGYTPSQDTGGVSVPPSAASRMVDAHNASRQDQASVPQADAIPSIPSLPVSKQQALKDAQRNDGGIDATTLAKLGYQQGQPSGMVSGNTQAQWDRNNDIYTQSVRGNALYKDDQYQTAIAGLQKQVNEAQTPRARREAQIELSKMQVDRGNVWDPISNAYKGNSDMTSKQLDVANQNANNPAMIKHKLMTDLISGTQEQKDFAKQYFDNEDARSDVKMSTHQGNDGQLYTDYSGKKAAIDARQTGQPQGKPAVLADNPEMRSMIKSLDGKKSPAERMTIIQNIREKFKGHPDLEAFMKSNKLV